MCVGLPARVIRIKDGIALVDASGAKREISAELLDDLDPGDYVMVHGPTYDRTVAGYRTKSGIFYRNKTFC